jgi:hypothetical protein
MAFLPGTGRYFAHQARMRKGKEIQNPQGRIYALAVANNEKEEKAGIS